MTKSPGHQQWPDHKVQEARLHRHVRVEVAGEPVADSTDVIAVQEDDCPVRYYFPRADVRMDKLQRTSTESECPFKGVARYFSISAGGKTLTDAVWTYEQPYEEHRGLQDRLAFYEEKFHDLAIRANGL